MIKSVPSGEPSWRIYLGGRIAVAAPNPGCPDFVMMTLSRRRRAIAASMVSYDQRNYWHALP